MKKIIRLNESDLEGLVKKILNEVGGEKFTDIEQLGQSEEMLKPAIAKLKGEDYIVVIDNKGKVFGYGPKVNKNMDKEQVCRIAQGLVDEWKEDVLMSEVDTGEFKSIRPITFCSK